MKFRELYNPPWQEEFYEYKYMKNKAINNIKEELDYIINKLKRNSSLCKTYLNKYHDEALIDCFSELSKNLEQQKKNYSVVYF